jgi:lipoprotein NlpD
VENITKRIFFLVFVLLLISHCASAHRKVRKKHFRSGVYHPVGKGQTLWRIAKTYKISLKELQRVNRIKNPSEIKVGDLVFIPRAKWIRKIHVPPPSRVTHRKKRSEKKVVTTRKRKVSPRSRKTSHKRKSKAPTSFNWPVKGRIISAFGYQINGQRHDGIDISAKKGAPIYAAAEGKVIYSNNRLRYFGNTVILKHTGGWFTVYAHNKRNLVNVGKRVRQGEKIALVGSSGRASKPILHFEIRGKEKPKNPLLYLPKR